MTHSGEWILPKGSVVAGITFGSAMQEGDVQRGGQRHKQLAVVGEQESTDMWGNKDRVDFVEPTA